MENWTNFLNQRLYYARAKVLGLESEKEKESCVLSPYACEFHCISYFISQVFSFPYLENKRFEFGEIWGLFYAWACPEHDSFGICTSNYCFAGTNAAEECSCPCNLETTLKRDYFNCISVVQLSLLNKFSFEQISIHSEDGKWLSVSDEWLPSILCWERLLSWVQSAKWTLSTGFWRWASISGARLPLICHPWPPLLSILWKEAPLENLSTKSSLNEIK